MQTERNWRTTKPFYRHLQWPLPLSKRHQNGTKSQLCNKCLNKNDVLLQRCLRIVPYIWVPWKFLWLPDYVYGYFSQIVSMPALGYAHAPFFPNVLLISCSDGPRECSDQIWCPLPIPGIIGGTQNLVSPWIHIRSLLSIILMGFCSDGPCECSGQTWSPYFTHSWDT